MRAFLFVWVVLVGGCSKKADNDKPVIKQDTTATLATGTVKDGVRTIEIEAGKDGYVPDVIPGTPGEKLKLVFTRTVSGECLGELVTPDGKKLALPMRQPVEVAITVPADGEVKFACGMDMFSAKVVAEKS